MQVTDFEYRHPTLVHQLIVGAAFLTYLLQPDDIVWWFVKDRPSPHVPERILFMAATLLIGIGAAICTRARVLQGQRRRHYHLGEFLYAIGLGSLAPLSGFVVLVLGEGIRILRLLKRDGVSPKFSPGTAISEEAVKWCVLVSMIVFVIMLRDRVIEILLAVSFVVGLVLNFRAGIRGTSRT